ncbi:alpha-N-arabinofuranosidase [Labilibaculum sp. A4]|uniref:alpha-N-arabinofuranosidase n=1 Tax=Labilibaculum TaxID=2060722 RepID=UPI000F61AF94|nr:MULTISPECIES: alpha-L-arabinofuranosidase C-terminal domain-containing protein [Labilibaculum]MBN2596844.1 alpha-N-arabinofuranosidase [Marinifilaceae bacterium]MDQ1770680.1 alpha-L-arabinofuranosidase C-terminal domain-containing protein [Labilibaculum euxinus]MWN75851.1 alpha-N-arabinofuranosidase [Labilibaculum euxinus]
MKIIKSKKYAIAVLSSLTILVGTQTLSAQNARIKIDVDRTIGEVDKNIYGNFVEHLGRCVYGGIYEENSPLSDENGIRLDVLDAVKELNVSITRYPGGNFVSNYNWKDGIGPKDDRPARMELAWSRLESNRFGTDEFMAYAKRMGTEPYFSVNMGTGTIKEAQEWVEYCNVKSGPYYAELRKKNGHEDPYNIKYWSLGNEMDGFWQMGHLNAEDYSKKAREAAKLMKLTSPEIKLIAAGSSNYRPNADPNEWNEKVLHELRDVIDYLALHMYVGNVENNYYNFVSSPLVLEERTRVVKGLIDREMQNADRGNRPPIYIAWDEYNIWYRARGEETMAGTKALEERYNLEDALVISGFLNAFIRNADIVKMANMAQLVNVIAPIFTSEKGMFKQTIFYPIQLFANNVKGTSLDVHVDCETYDTGKFFIGLGESTTIQKDVPFLDVSATYNNGEVIVCVMNRNKDKAITTDLLCQEGIFDGEFEVYEINGPDIKSENDFGKTSVETKKKSSLKVKKSDKITYDFPAHSFTMIKGSIVK